MILLQNLQEERPDFAYSALYGSSSAILSCELMRKKTGLEPYFAFDWLKLRAKFFERQLNPWRTCFENYSFCMKMNGKAEHILSTRKLEIKTSTRILFKICLNQKSSFLLFLVGQIKWESYLKP